MKKIYLIILFQFLFADYGGGYAGSSFRYGTNAREFSLSGSLVADKTPGFYIFSNPALLKYVRSNELGFSYQAMALDRSIQSMCFVRPLPPSGGVGMAILRAGTRNIMGKNSMNENTQIFTSQDILGIISFGVSFSSKIALGLNIKAFFSNIAPEIIEKQSSSGIGIDLGLLYKLNRNIIFGGVIENLLGNYNWKITNNSDQDSYTEVLPQIMKLGISYKGLKSTTIYLQEDMVKIPTNGNINFRSRLGMEYHMLSGIKIRIGLRQVLGMISEMEKNEKLFSTSFGVGIPLKLWNSKFARMDYALDPGSVGEGLSHLFSLYVKFKK
ncbi:MAG: hypothetical protein VX820_02985 [Candidatus Neomarinimicrobiota bacterium]|nr:hypothetical protein [Candidatus Neomarinimicrobiota bacterium]|tara:strand:- start:420 stop:1397 length:978 start_codon:yes stop_codon:yes gene_type:complete